MEGMGLKLTAGDVSQSPLACLWAYSLGLIATLNSLNRRFISSCPSIHPLNVPIVILPSTVIQLAEIVTKYTIVML